jgi:hypothetical protein
MDLTEFRILILSNFMHPLKHPFPVLVTDFGIVMEGIDEQSENNIFNASN